MVRRNLMSKTCQALVFSQKADEFSSAPCKLQ